MIMTDDIVSKDMLITMTKSFVKATNNVIQKSHFAK